MSEETIALPDLSALYQKYMNLSEKLNQSSIPEPVRTETKIEKEKLSEQIRTLKWRDPHQRPTETDMNALLDTMAEGIRSGKVDAELLPSIGHYAQRIAETAPLDASLTGERQKHLDAVFEALTDRFRTSNGNEAKTISDIVHTAAQADIKASRDLKTISPDIHSDFVAAMITHPHYSSSEEITQHAQEGYVSADVRSGFIKDPNRSFESAWAMSGYGKLSKSQGAMADRIPDNIEDFKNIADLETRRDIAGFIKGLDPKLFKGKRKDGTLAHFAPEKYKQANDLRASEMQEMLTGKDKEEQGGYLGNLEKWFQRQVNRDRIAATREHRPLSETEEKNLIMSSFVYLTLTQHANRGVRKQGTDYTPPDPDKYLEQMQGYLARSQEYGLAPKANGRGGEDVQISFETGLKDFIPKEQTVQVEKTREVRAKNLLGRLMGRKEQQTEIVDETRPLTSEEQSKKLAALGQEFSGNVEKAFYEHLAVRVNLLAIDNTTADRSLLNVAEKVNQTEFVLNASDPIRDKLSRVNASNEMSREDVGFIEQTDVNGDKYQMRVRQNDNTGKIRDTAFAALKEKYER